MRFYYECPECSTEHLITSLDDVPIRCENLDCHEPFNVEKIEQKFHDFATNWEPDYDENK